MKPKIAIDIGSAYTKIYKTKVDVVLCEPTCIAIKNKNYRNPFACGLDAYALIGKTPENVEIIFPVNGGEITNNRALVSLLEYFVKKIKKPFEIVQDVLLSVGCGFNREIIKTFENALLGAKLYNVCFAESPLLALLGCGEDLSYETPNAVIDFGGSQTTVCVLTLAGVISGASAEIGGNNLNKMIISHLETQHNFLISNHSAEMLKTQLASLDEDDETKIVISGKDTLSGKQKVSQISASQIYPAVKSFMDRIVEIITVILSGLSTETIDGLNKNGIYLTGGGAGIYGISDYLNAQLEIKTQVAEENDIASIIGAGKLVEDNELLEKLKLKV